MPRTCNFPNLLTVHRRRGLGKLQVVGTFSNLNKKVLNLRRRRGLGKLQIVGIFSNLNKKVLNLKNRDRENVEYFSTTEIIKIPEIPVKMIDLNQSILGYVPHAVKSTRCVDKFAILVFQKKNSLLSEFNVVKREMRTYKT